MISKLVSEAWDTENESHNEERGGLLMAKKVIPIENGQNKY